MNALTPPRMILTRHGGIAVISTPRMEYMAKASWEELCAQDIEDVEFHTILFTEFPCGEVKPKIKENVRHKDVYLFFDFNGDLNHAIMNLMLTLHAIHLAGAESITLVTPYLPYLRQDRKDEPRVPISAALLVQMIELIPSVERVITIDMHSEQMQAVFKIPTDHLPGTMVFAPWARQRFAGRFTDVVAVAPDYGSGKRVRKLANEIDPTIGIAILEKNRNPSGVEVLNIIGASIAGKICLINDDMMDTCGTILKAVDELYRRGAAQVVLTATHAIFSPKDGTTAYQKLENGPANLEVVVTDSLQSEGRPWLTVLPLARYLAHAILQNVLRNGSVSTLIKEGIPQ